MGLGKLCLAVYIKILTLKFLSPKSHIILRILSGRVLESMCFSIMSLIIKLLRADSLYYNMANQGFKSLLRKISSFTNIRLVQRDGMLGPLSNIKGSIPKLCIKLLVWEGCFQSMNSRRGTPVFEDVVYNSVGLNGKIIERR